MIQISQNTAIRLAIGGFKFSPIKCIQNIANKTPPDLRRTKLLFLCYARTKKIKTTLLTYI